MTTLPDLSLASSLSSADLLIIRQSGQVVDKKLALSVLETYLNTALSFPPDINGQTQDSSPSGANDFLLTYDASAGANKKVAVHDVFKTITTLTAETTYDPTADHLVVYDNSASAPRKMLIDDILVTAATGSRVLLASETLSAASDIQIGDGLAVDAVIDGTYDAYEIEIVSCDLNGGIYVQTSSNGGVSFDSTAGSYKYASVGLNDAGTTRNYASTGATFITMGAPAAVSGYAVNGKIRLSKPSDTSLYTQLMWDMGYIEASAHPATIRGSGCRYSIGAVDAIRIYDAGASINGIIKVYGIK